VARLPAASALDFRAARNVRPRKHTLFSPLEPGDARAPLWPLDLPAAHAPSLGRVADAAVERAGIADEHDAGKLCADAGGPASHTRVRIAHTNRAGGEFAARSRRSSAHCTARVGAAL